MSSGAPLSAKVFAVTGASLVVIAAILACLGSFAYPVAAAVGLLFLAAAVLRMAAQARRRRRP